MVGFKNHEFVYFQKAFKYLRATDLNYLEFYEKYFILYNTMSVRDYTTAAQYLWLFQKLNTSSLVSASSEITGANVVENELGLFKLMSKSSSSAAASSSASLSTLNELNKLKHEQKMHSRLIITIYLMNSMVNEAYNLIKPHLKNVKSVFKNQHFNQHSGVRFSKELIIHFFLQIDRSNWFWLT